MKNIPNIFVKAVVEEDGVATDGAQKIIDTAIHKTNDPNISSDEQRLYFNDAKEFQKIKFNQDMIKKKFYAGCAFLATLAGAGVIYALRRTNNEVAYLETDDEPKAIEMDNDD